MRERDAARRRIAELTRADRGAGAGAGGHADPGAEEARRIALVAELAEAIREAARTGDQWRPDYEDLMTRTGRQRRWCEYLVRDARSAVFATTGQAPADGAPQPAPQPARADPGAGHLARANGNGP